MYDIHRIFIANTFHGLTPTHISAFYQAYFFWYNSNFKGGSLERGTYFRGGLKENLRYFIQYKLYVIGEFS